MTLDHIRVTVSPNVYSFRFAEREYGTIHGHACGCAGVLVMRDSEGRETEQPIKLFDVTSVAGGWDSQENGLLDLTVETDVPGFERACMLLKPGTDPRSAEGLIFLP